jgi:hypothetical protein
MSRNFVGYFVEQKMDQFWGVIKPTYVCNGLRFPNSFPYRLFLCKCVYPEKIPEVSIMFVRGDIKCWLYMPR